MDVASTIHVDMAPGGQLDVELATGMWRLELGGIILGGSPAFSQMQFNSGSLSINGSDSACRFDLQSVLEPDASNSVGGTMTQTGCTVSIEVDGNDFQLPDGDWTMTVT